MAAKGKSSKPAKTVASKKAGASKKADAAANPALPARLVEIFLADTEFFFRYEPPTPSP